jgi:ABC-type lipoprotein export system ATPase subunit
MSNPDPSNILECRGNQKTYHDGTRALEILRDVNVVVPEGRILAISGPSGVGKSTLLHIMGTLDNPTGGEVFFRGEPLAQMGAAKVNRIRNHDIGFVFQFYHLLPEFSALENVMMPALCKNASRRSCRGRAEELLDKVGLKDRMTHKPGQLSGGEQQRVAIARAIAKRPEVLLCDEPTGALDVRTGIVVLEAIQRANRELGTLTVIITHNAVMADMADRVIHFSDGRVHHIHTNERRAPASSLNW